MTELNTIQITAIATVAGLTNLQDLEQARVALLGKNGQITGLLKQLGSMAPEDRKTFGQKVNKVKIEVSTALEQRKENLESVALNEKLANEAVDITLPATHQVIGKMHPVSYVMEEVAEVLGKVGFTHTIGKNKFHYLPPLTAAGALPK